MSLIIDTARKLTDNINVKTTYFVYSIGKWSIVSKPDIVLDKNLMNMLVTIGKLVPVSSSDVAILYRLKFTRFRADVQNYIELLDIFLGKQFFAYKDLRYFANMFDYKLSKSREGKVMFANCRVMDLSKDNFIINLPYDKTNRTQFLKANALFKIICKIIYALYIEKSDCAALDYPEIEKLVLEWSRNNR